MSNIEYWESKIRADLAPFGDPGTILHISRSGLVFTAAWTQRRAEMEAQFVVRDFDGVQVRFRERQMPYRAFFASEEMADLYGIAKTTLGIIKAGIYVDTLAEPNFAGNSPRSALSVVADLVERDPEVSDATAFIMITGEAGAGKTFALKELVRRQALAYSEKRTDFVYLYVNAQGRALARFNEALATELNELRVALPHHAVPVLVRLGLVVPVIDGFDELLGVGGYDDAFGSIAAFVGELEGAGAMVASARSTYFEQEFLSRSSRPGREDRGGWRLSSVAVSGWGEREVLSYISQRCTAFGKATVDDLAKKVSKIFSGQNTDLSQKPLFVSRVTELLLSGVDDIGGGALLERLVGALVSREQKEKLLNKAGAPILDASAISSLCSDIAEEMWNLGTRELDRLTIRDIGELAVIELNLSAQDKQVVVDRLPKLAFLQPGEMSGSVCFEHELFFDHFLSTRLASALLSGGVALSMLLSRSAVPESLAELVAKDVLARGGVLSSIVASLSAAADALVPRQQQVRENAGRFAAATVRAFDGTIESVSFHNLVFPGSSFHALEFRACSFSACEFRRCDFSSTRFVECVGLGATFDQVLIDKRTFLGVRDTVVSDFSGLRVAEDTEVDTTFDPTVIQQLLSTAGLPSASGTERLPIRQVPSDVIALIDRLARAYSKCNPICVQDGFMSKIFDNPEWPTVRAIGLESEVLRSETKSTSGPKSDFVRRLVLAEHLVAGAVRGADVPDSVTVFWNRLEEHYMSGSG